MHPPTASLEFTELRITKTDITAIARSLAVSPRNLQGKLKNEGATYSTLLKKVRKELAYKYLANNNLSLFKVSCLLGFSDQSAFNRSFKRWTGLSPRQYRLQPCLTSQSPPPKT